ncbi:hypothetical protein [Streptomyces scabiei]|uniref:hypothetical protein n=1 Tax=Streptomyces scabiei TaxID=1930 RepID=UPI000A9B6197|nr:hypothetical protein [Streptomyces scabiei]
MVGDDLWADFARPAPGRRVSEQLHEAVGERTRSRQVNGQAAFARQRTVDIRRRLPLSAGAAL